MTTFQSGSSTAQRLVATAAVLVVSVEVSWVAARAEETSVPATAPAPAQRLPLDPAVSPGGSGAASTNAVAGAADTFVTGGILTTGSSGAADDTSEAVLQRRRKSGGNLTNTLPRSVESHGGVLPYVARERKAASVLQLFNPFAPASLGTGTAAVFEWRPGNGAAPLPRAFRDERTHEAEGIQVISVTR